MDLGEAVSIARRSVMPTDPRERGGMKAPLHTYGSAVCSCRLSPGGP